MPHHRNERPREISAINSSKKAIDVDSPARYTNPRQYHHNQSIPNKPLNYMTETRTLRAGIASLSAALISSAGIFLTFAPLAGAQSSIGAEFGSISEVPGVSVGGLNLAPPAPFVPPSNVSSPLTFNFTLGAGLVALQGSDPVLAASVIGGFTGAADLWREALVDPITINLTIDYTALGPGILGSTSTATFGATYSNSRLALIGDRKSADDFTAAANLPNVAARTVFTNDRAGTKILDNDGSANNSQLDIARANGKAIGLIAANDGAADGAVTFSSSFGWDFNRGDGITGGQFDFVGVAAHEIGHLMGFVSGVDVVDIVSGAGPSAGADLNGGAPGIGTINPFRVFNILDLYRYSAQAVSQGPGVLDLAFGGTPFFSINGGTTNLGAFSTGSFNGDGRQASHWKDNLALGIMDPTLAPGELAVIRPLDILAFDVIGYDLVPEPGTATLLAFGVIAISARRRRTAIIGG